MTTKKKTTTKLSSAARRSPAHVQKSATTGRYQYVVSDPMDATADAEAIAKIRAGLIRLMDTPDEAMSPVEALERAVRDVVVRLRLDLPEAQLKRILAQLARDFLGYGRIHVPMLDPNIEDISCDGPNVPIYVFHRQYGPMESNIVFHDEAELDAFVIRMAQMCNREITYARPMLEATLPDGSRLQASLAREITTRGSSFTIRRFRADPMTPLDLIQSKTMDAKLAAYLWMAVESHVSILFAGGTASGKTTQLNASCVFIPPDEKIVSIEDTRELTLAQQNWAPGLTRPPLAGAGTSGSAQEVDMYKLLETALRQRPDFIIVGEVRGPEAVTLFQAMATGHATYSTIHADSPLTAVRRLENPPINVPRNLIEALGIIVMNGRVATDSPSSRRILEVSEIAGVDEETGDLLTRLVFRWDQATDTHEYMGRSRVLERLLGAKFPTGEALEAEWDRRAAFLAELAKGPRLDIQGLMAKLSAPQPASTKGRRPPSGS